MKKRVMQWLQTVRRRFGLHQAQAAPKLPSLVRAFDHEKMALFQRQEWGPTHPTFELLMRYLKQVKFKTYSPAQGQLQEFETQAATLESFIEHLENGAYIIQHREMVPTETVAELQQFPRLLNLDEFLITNRGMGVNLETAVSLIIERAEGFLQQYHALSLEEDPSKERYYTRRYTPILNTLFSVLLLMWALSDVHERPR